MSQKYIFVNGVMKLNPAFGKTTANPQSLAVVSSMSDIQQATDAQAQGTGSFNKFMTIFKS
jgi:hypothetical protein